MDLEIENRIAAILLKEATELKRQAGNEGVHVYLQQPKAVIRGLLLSTLDDPNRKLCTATSMAVAAIAVYEWPESWPDLLLFLLKLIGDQTSMNEGVEKERGCNSTR
ncbi:hypothetical protein ERO13_A10G119000v2 [Gossypium hirsutum]|uniref:Importin N-terminal domain-containing protein n=1 Tax=Gossypium mustelinum TaxID=34275 RepID=A0A5D2XNP6_GOSMU|nr:hypothetical protein ERO13_A10G119000v2 [Gossypium hirsutum]TYJ14611.1 hypothetical protein E1A91_A10G129400v1 [Gossypium mustelinum]TYJ14612.1 hypothetical protein E1A91_A10G129400v1 [Gossypium mustelinum]